MSARIPGHSLRRVTTPDPIQVNLDGGALRSVVSISLNGSQNHHRSGDRPSTAPSAETRQKLYRGLYLFLKLGCSEMNRATGVHDRPEPIVQGIVRVADDTLGGGCREAEGGAFPVKLADGTVPLAASKR